MKSLYRLIAGRYLFSSRQRFAKLLTAVALGGVILGVWSLIVVLGIMRGFGEELAQRWVGLDSHLTLSGETAFLSNWRSAVRQWPEVEEITTYVEGEVIVQSRLGDKISGSAAKLRGVDKIGGDFLKKVKIYPAEIEEEAVMGGEELLAILGVHPRYQNEVTVVYPFGEIGPAGDWVPRKERFLVTHAFRTGIYEWDAYRLVVPFGKAATLLGEQGETGLQIRLKNLGDLSQIESRLKALVGRQGEVKSFAEKNRRLFAALHLERMAMTLFLVLFGLIGSFSITGLLLMFVDAKRRDLAILRSIGLNAQDAKKLFLSIGLWLGGIGTLIGGLLGLLTCLFLREFPIRLPSTYYLDSLPVRFELLQIVLVMGIGLLLALLSSLYPVMLAGKFDPLPMLREE